jgi:hypothetical protein
MKLTKTHYNRWQESVPHAEYEIVLVGSEYRVFRLNLMIGKGLTLEQAEEIIREDIADR